MRRIAAADWFRVRPLADGVTWIDEPHVREFYRCNIWHLRGRERDLLVDSGWGVVSLRRHIPLVTERPLVAVAYHQPVEAPPGRMATPFAPPRPGSTPIRTPSTMPTNMSTML